MKTQTNNTQPSLKTRLAAFVLVLIVGFVMGCLNGNSSDSATDTSSGIIAQQQAQDTSLDDQADQSDREAAAAENQAQTQTDVSDSSATDTTTAPTRGPTVTEDGWYTSKEEVALYIHTYGYLPDNFISKTKARERGWVASEGNLQDVCPGMSIGGSVFYNDDGLLPDKQGRRWTECDINYSGGYRGAERIVFSNDGLVFYTDDHYKTFEQLY